MNILLILCACLIWITRISSEPGYWGLGMMSDEKRLVKHLIENYEKVGLVGRPVYNTSEVVNVQMNLSLLHVLDIDPDSQIFEFIGIVMLTWEDILIQWSSPDFGGVSSIVVPWTGIWTPGMMLMNTIETVASTESIDTRPRVSSQGHVQWAMQYRFKTFCNMNPGADSILCRLKFGAWSYPENELSLQFTSKRVDTSSYVPNHTWDLKRTKAKKTVREHPCCPDGQYEDITYTVNFERRPRRSG